MAATLGYPTHILVERRLFLKLAVGALASSAAACAKPCAPPTLPLASGRKVVDAHCHAFNASDLSPVRFVRYAHLQLYPEAADHPVSDVNNPDLLDSVIQALLVLVGASSAPTATAETRLLSGRAVGAGVDEVAAREQTVERLSRYIAERSDTDPADFDAPAPDRARALIQEAVFSLGLRGQDMAVSGGGFDPPARREIAAQFVDSADAGEAPVAAGLMDVPQLFRWLQLFRRHRHCLVDELTARHRRAGWNPVLLTPAMVDYGYWLEEQPTSSLADQVEVWEAIAARDGGPAVHAYVAFDPLREALRRAGRIREPEAPLALVERALLNHGCLGVKLYPPMGFSAVGNAERDFSRIPFSVKVLERRFGSVTEDQERARSRELGAELDAAMADLFSLCERLDAPVLAHGGPGNAISRNAGELSDPWRWSGLFQSPRPTRPLRVLLAHYARFTDRSHDPAGEAGQESAPYSQTHEAAFQRLLNLPGAGSVMVDMSHLTQVIGLAGEDRESLLSNLRQFLPIARDRLVFGTDWTMLGLQRGEQGYDSAVESAFSDAGLDGPAMDALLAHNFVRFAGLRPGEASRLRLDAFHASRGRASRLDVLD